MPRSIAAYLADILDAADSIQEILKDVDLASYAEERALRSAVEREFIIVGEAVAAILRAKPELADDISHARMVIGFRNILTHDCAAIDDETVYDVAITDLPLLRLQCAELLSALEDSGR